jgi:tetratricopeptide (TPR) repeat protein/DNA-binding XRE family transcriptional regulator
MAGNSGKFADFGGALRFYRKRARMTQDELGRMVGYSREQITHLESGRRLPDVTSIAALFIPELAIDDDAAAAELIALATRARNQPPPTRITRTREIETDVVVTSETSPETVADSAVQAAEIARHRQAAQWAEMAEGDFLKAAREYVLAGDLKEAADLLTDQGTVLAGQGRSDETAQVVDLLLGALEKRPGGQAAHADLVCRLLGTRGDALLNTARAGEAENDYQRGIALSSGAVRASLTYRLCGSLVQRGKATEAVAIAREALAALPPQLVLLRAQLHVVESGALIGLSRLPEAETSAHAANEAGRALAVATPLISAGIRARAVNMLATIHATRLEFDRAIELWREVSETARLAGIRALEHRATMNMAIAMYEQGNLPGSTVSCAAATEGFRAINDHTGLARILHLSSLLAYSANDIQESIARSREAITVKQTMGDIGSLALSHKQLAKALMVDQQFDEARAVLTSALDESSRSSTQLVRGAVILTLAELDIAEARPDDAIERCEALLVDPAIQDLAKLIADCHRVLVLAHAHKGDMRRARAAYQPAPVNHVELEYERRLIEELLADPHAPDGLNAFAVEADARGFHLIARRARSLNDALSLGDRVAAVRALVP